MGKQMRRFVKVLLVFVMLVAYLSPQAMADTLSQDDIDSIYRDSVWYVGNSATSTLCSANNAINNSSLPADIIDAINKLKDVYTQASEATGVPWQVLAAIHYRESNNSPTADLQAGNPIGGPYSQQSTAYSTYGYPKTMEESAEIAAKELIGKTKGGGLLNLPVNVPSPDAEGLKDALFSYNGRASVYAQQAKDLGFDPNKQPYEGSPYVMNEFDEIHKDMKIITKDNGPLDGTDTRFGAYTIYTKLGGATGGGDCTSQGTSAIVQTAIKYAWPDYTPPVYLKKKPEYQTAITEAFKRGEYVGPINEPYLGVDCGAFVTRVMRDSGADPNYNEKNGNTIAQQIYLDAHPEKYEKLKNVNGTNDLLAGDIAINDVHTYLYVGKQPGFNGNSASASFSDTGASWRSPMASNAYGFSSFSWYRLKGGG